MKHFKHLIALALLLLLGTSAGLAQPTQPRFSAVADRTQLFVGEQLELTLSVEGPGASDLSQLPPPELGPVLQLAGQNGPSTHYSMSIVNGRMERSGSMTLVYVFQGRQPGVVTIPELTLTLGGMTLKSLPIKVQVLEPSAPQPTGGGWVPPADPYLEIKVNKTEVYQGEQVVAAWYFYFRQPFTNVNVERTPVTGDFLSVELGTVSSLSPETKELGGQTWQVAFLKSVALFPVKAQDSLIEPMTLTCYVRGRRQDFFGNAEVVPRQVSSDPVTIKVKPLPEEGKPADFGGAVGKFNLYLSSPAGNLAANAPFKFTLTVEGDGHPDFIPKPELKLPDGFELFTESASKDSRQEAGHAVGVRRYKMILVAHSAGEFDLPAFQFSYFDPEESQYKTMSASLGHVRVAPGQGGPASLAPLAEPMTALGQDLRYLKDPKQLPDAGDWRLRSPLWLGLQLVPLLALAAAFGLQRRKEKLSRDVGYARKLRAGRKVKKALRDAGTAVKKGDPAAACAGVHRALTGFLADQFTLPEQGMTSADALAALKNSGANEDLIAALEKLLGACDQARFTASAFSTHDAQDLLGQGQDLIARLAREARK